jgi:hypothetical protein
MSRDPSEKSYTHLFVAVAAAGVEVFVTCVVI